MVEDIRKRAVQLITQQAVIERVVKRCRVRCLMVLILAFGSGFAVGTTMPFMITAVPIQPVVPDKR